MSLRLPSLVMYSCFTLRCINRLEYIRRGCNTSVTGRRVLGILTTAPYSSSSSSSSNAKSCLPTKIKNIRNIGVIAHIDAGKTTTTERMLFYAGVTNFIGDVDYGTTVTDYMAQERERGITIVSAAISFAWKNHRINLIDTPGHVDFTVEVERAMRVLDGTVVVLDGAAGVQAQTLTVWRQAQRYSLPVVFFVNKMDRDGASLDKTVRSIQSKLPDVRPLVVQFPIGEDMNFCGVVDIIDGMCLRWGDAAAAAAAAGGGGDKKSENIESGIAYSAELLNESIHGKELVEKSILYRRNLLENLSELDDGILDAFMLEEEGGAPVSSSDIRSVLRRVTLERKGAAVLCGSSLHNRGVQPLLDAVTQLLPSPLERAGSRSLIAHHVSDHTETAVVPSLEAPLVAYAFKVITDKKRGSLVFLRVYSGYLRMHEALINTCRLSGGNAIVSSDYTNRGHVKGPSAKMLLRENMMQLLEPAADDLVPRNEVSAGNIAVVVGLKHTTTGDTIMSSTKASQYLRLEGMNIRSPVFYCTVEPESNSGQAALDSALNSLQREDPTFVVSADPDSTQTLMRGMGELHLEIMRDRLVREFGVKPIVGPIQVSFKEAISQGSEEHITTVDKGVGSKRVFCTVTMQLLPGSEGEPTFSYDDDAPKNEEISLIKDTTIASTALPSISLDVIEAARQGAMSSLSRGVMLGFPVWNVHVRLCNIALPTDMPPVAASSASAQCVREILRKLSPNFIRILEPMMSLSVVTDENHVGSVMSDLTGVRRAVIRSIHDTDYLTRTVKAVAPLSALIGYSRSLRTLTSGAADFSMDFLSYGMMTQQEQDATIARLRGLSK